MFREAFLRALRAAISRFLGCHHESGGLGHRSVVERCERGESPLSESCGIPTSGRSDLPEKAGETGISDNRSAAHHGSAAPR